MVNVAEKIAHRSHEAELSVEGPDHEAEQQREALREKLEHAEKEHRNRAPEKEILAEAKQLAHEKEEHNHKEDQPTSPAERRRGPITKKQLDNSFNAQMAQARSHMSPGSRMLSKFIHLRPVEVVSDVISSTIARPNALLSGSIAAFVVVTILYFTAKYYGFSLSGFETIGAFILGWIIGILYDYFSVMIRGHK